MFDRLVDGLLAVVVGLVRPPNIDVGLVGFRIELEEETFGKARLAGLVKALKFWWRLPRPRFMWGLVRFGVVGLV